MKIIRTLKPNCIPPPGCALTIGNFDGVHRGHRALLNHLVATAHARPLPVAVMTFFPSPEEYFRGREAAPRLTGLTDRYDLLQQAGVDWLLAIPFNRRLASCPAAAFIDTIRTALNLQYLLVGDDFHFGAGRTGDYQVLKSAGDVHGFEVEQLATVTDADGRISSRRIRRALAAGQLAHARQLLGHAFSLSGRVIHGERRGRQWGFPTANLPLRRRPPLTGVFAVVVTGAGLMAAKAVANVGTRPTVGGLRMLAEVHLFDGVHDLYGQRLRIEFVSKIRDEIKFASFTELKAQIQRDCEQAKQVLSSDYPVISD